MRRDASMIRVVAMIGVLGVFGVLGCPADPEPDAMGTEGTTSASGDGTAAGSATTAPNPGSSSSASASASASDDAEPTSVSGSSATDEGEDGATGDADSTGGTPVSDCSAEELELIDLVNGYRGENGLPPIPASPSLCIVGHTHAEDLAVNAPHAEPGCNLHSWSDAGPWSACCYTDDHAEAQCMWDKPSELTSYPGNGYENAAGGGGELTPQQALDLWKSSPGHNAVILNDGIWADTPWGALGAGVHEGYAVLWFGEEPDPRS